MRYMTLSDMKANAANLECDEPIIVTQNGLPQYVVQSYAEYERKQEAIALVKLLAIGSQQYREGKHISTEELMDRLKKRYDAAGQ